MRTRLGVGLPPPSLTSVAETSGGNPFFALEIARATLRGDTRATGLALPIPRNLRDDLVRDRVGSLPSSLQEVLLYASASSRPTVALVEAALERPDILAQLAEAVDARIVETDDGVITFVHPVYRSAIYADASRAHRHRVHRRLSAVVEDEEQRARHLALAADGPDAAAAASLEHAATYAAPAAPPPPGRSSSRWPSGSLLLTTATTFAAAAGPPPSVISSPAIEVSRSNSWDRSSWMPNRAMNVRRRSSSWAGRSS